MKRSLHTPPHTVAFQSLVGLSALIVLLLVLPAGGLRTADAEDFRQPLSTFLGRYCTDCHADGANEGGLHLERLGNDLNDAATFAKWVGMLDRVRSQEMPPEDCDQPSPQDRATFATVLGNYAYQSSEPITFSVGGTRDRTMYYLIRY